MNPLIVRIYWRLRHSIITIIAHLFDFVSQTCQNLCKKLKFKIEEREFYPDRVIIKNHILMLCAYPQLPHKTAHFFRLPCSSLAGSAS
jgi:hypothetical protein